MRAACLDLPVQPKVVVAVDRELHRLDCDCASLVPDGTEHERDAGVRPGDFWDRVLMRALAGTAHD